MPVSREKQQANRAENREEYNAYMREYRKRNKDKHRDYEFKSHYGITLKEYNEIREAQNFLCACCGTPEVTCGRLVVDHDHESNFVRGLLCSSCNVGLGYFKDDINTLEQAIKYLNRHKELVQVVRDKLGTDKL